MNKTSLWNVHKNLGATFIDYGGWNIPIHYKSGIVNEHLSVRNKVGIFDVSHIGFISISGTSLLPFLNNLTTNIISNKTFNVTYTIFPTSKGGCIDDVLVYHLDENESFIVPNCSNTQIVFEHLKIYGLDYNNLKIKKHTNKTIIALQGPDSTNVLNNIFDVPILLPKNKIVIKKYQGLDVIISNTGYRGEKGYELFIDNTKG
jgi:aminomethyltransferase